MGVPPLPASFTTDYNELITDIVTKTYSLHLEDLNALVHEGSQFKSVLSDCLGFEVANFYFHDTDLVFFHEAIAEGIEMPFFQISGFDKKNRKFISSKVPKHEVSERRSKQFKSLSKEDDPSTAMLGYGELTTAEMRRWSADEERNNWILIPEGEVIVFAFEYMLRTVLKNDGITTKSEALRVNETTEIAARCWDLMHDPNSHRYMAGREQASFANGLMWLSEVLNDRDGYRYLWESNPAATNWFIYDNTEATEFITSPSSEGSNVDTMRQLGHLILKHSYPHSEDGGIDLDAARFFERSRISPSLELQHGTHNIVIFLIRPNLSGSRTEISEPIKVLLLGTFYDRRLCEANHDKIRNIYSILTTRDLLRYSMDTLERNLKKARKNEEILAALSGANFVHELGKIGQIRWQTDLITTKGREKGFLSEIEPQLAKIEGIVEKASSVVKASREMAELSLVPDTELMMLSKALPEIVEAAKKTLEVPENVLVNVQVVEEDIWASVDPYSLQLTLENLVKNAIEAMKGTENARIDIRCWRETAKIKLSVTDNGTGVANEVLAGMFDLFRSTKKGQKLSGIGLFLCKNLIEAQDGTIEGSNSVSGGATFTVTLPAAHEEKESIP